VSSLFSFLSFFSSSSFQIFFWLPLLFSCVKRWYITIIIGTKTTELTEKDSTLACPDDFRA